MIPDDVTIQVLTQCRPELIEPHLRGAAAAPSAPIVHLYNSTSTCSAASCSAWTYAGIIEIAVTGAKLIKQLADAEPDTEWVLRIFAGELHRHRARVRAGDLRRRSPTSASRRRRSKLILNLPATVEMATPNIYADQIEWMLPQPRVPR